MYKNITKCVIYKLSIANLLENMERNIWVKSVQELFLIL